MSCFCKIAQLTILHKLDPTFGVGAFSPFILLFFWLSSSNYDIFADRLPKLFTKLCHAELQGGFWPEKGLAFLSSVSLFIICIFFKFQAHTTWHTRWTPTRRWLAVPPFGISLFHWKITFIVILSVQKSVLKNYLMSYIEDNECMYVRVVLHL